MLSLFLSTVAVTQAKEIAPVSGNFRELTLTHHLNPTHYGSPLDNQFGEPPINCREWEAGMIMDAFVLNLITHKLTEWNVMWCSPHCAFDEKGTVGSCPTDIPSGYTTKGAKPTCTGIPLGLNKSVANCIVECEVDSDCGTGAKCVDAKQSFKANMCAYPYGDDPPPAVKEVLPPAAKEILPPAKEILELKPISDKPVLNVTHYGNPYVNGGCKSDELLANLADIGPHGVAFCAPMCSNGGAKDPGLCPSDHPSGDKGIGSCQVSTMSDPNTFYCADACAMDGSVPCAPGGYCYGPLMDRAPIPKYGWGICVFPATAKQPAFTQATPGLKLAL